MNKMSSRLSIRLLAPALLSLLVNPTGLSAASYDGYRWFQIEISIFTNDYPEYRDAELWSPERLRLGYPARAREFRQLAEFLQLEDFAQRLSGGLSRRATQVSAEPVQEGLDSAVAVGPFPAKPVTDLQLLDLDRQAFLLLPPALSDFQTTNSRLERSPVNRLLFSGVWRQPVVQQEDASPLIIRGGSQFGQHHELEGTVTLRFNTNEDRVVIDANLWMTEFSRSGDGNRDWELPPPPGSTANTGIGGRSNNRAGSMEISRIVQMRESRDMRSNEFHYLDHPVMGLVISVFPYDLPAPATLDLRPDPAEPVFNDVDPQ
jgi:hypothetical protein